METVLIVDDEKNYPRVISAVLQEEGFESLTAHNGREAITILENSDVDLVLTDVKMPSMDGIELLEAIKMKDPDLPVIMMTAHGTVKKAVEAIQKGAFDYLLKPFDNESLVKYATRAADMFRVIKENRTLRNAFKAQFSFGNIIGKSKNMQDVYTTIRKVAPTTATVLIEGESGTGKELVAKSIHFNSFRRNKPFIAVNCSALSENLLESELFGHERGAFTGAVANKKGRFELADGGDLFLDEIGELPQNLQVKLLRVLQEKTFERVGGVKPISVDIRFIAATNKNLKSETDQGRFREDLFYRLNVVYIDLPGLRERREDIHLLTDHFIKKYTETYPSDIEVIGVNQEVYRLFHEYDWPGNVRELENVIERAMIMCTGEMIGVSDLPVEFRKNTYNTLNLEGISEDAKLSPTLAMVEKMMIERALKITHNVQAHAAGLLGISKSWLNQKIKKLHLDVKQSADRVAHRNASDEFFGSDKRSPKK